MGAWAVDLFTDRQRAGFLIRRSHSNPVFSIPSYRSWGRDGLPTSMAATSCGGAGPGLRVKWFQFWFRLCHKWSVTLGKSTFEKFRPSVSALLTHKCFLGNWDDALPWGSQGPISMSADTEASGGELLQPWGSAFTRTESCPQARAENLPRFGGTHFLLKQVGLLIARDQEEVSSAQHQQFWEWPCLRLELLEANAENSGFLSALGELGNLHRPDSSALSRCPHENFWDWGIRVFIVLPDNPHSVGVGSPGFCNYYCHKKSLVHL